MEMAGTSKPLPWGRPTAGSVTLPGGDSLEVRLLPCDTVRRLLSLRSQHFSEDSEGAFLAPAGTSYEIEVKLRERTPSRGATLRVVRASIDGQEINEQLILTPPSTLSARFVGWLQDPTGAKRLRFTFPTQGESSVQVGVFAATEAGGASGKAAQAPAPPPSATGASFAGPTVGSRRYVLGEPVAVGLARLKVTAQQ